MKEGGGGANLRNAISPPWLTPKVDVHCAETNKLTAVLEWKDGKVRKDTKAPCQLTVPFNWNANLFWERSDLPQIGTINEDALDDHSKDEGVFELTPGRVVEVVIDIDKVKLVVLNLLPLPVVYLQVNMKIAKGRERESSGVERGGPMSGFIHNKG